MPAVCVRNNNVDGALKSLRTQLAKDGTLSTARDRADGYKKPGVRARLEKENNTRNCRNRNSKGNGHRKNY